MNLLVLLSKFRDWVALVLALILSMILMNSSSHPGAEKFRFGVGRVVSFISAPFMLVPRTITVWGENAELRAEIAQYALERNEWRDATLENIRLRKMLGFHDRPEFNYIAAIAIARNPAMNMSSLQLDKGSADSVCVGQAVVTSEGLAGVIHHVGKRTSIAQLATDPNFAASVRIERSRLDGILRWYSRETLLIDGITKNRDIKAGDRVVTSGLGGVIAGGIPVGIVTRVSSEKGDIFLGVRVDPFVRFSSLEEVFILLSAGINTEVAE